MLSLIPVRARVSWLILVAATCRVRGHWGRTRHGSVVVVAVLVIAAVKVRLVAWTSWSCATRRYRCGPSSRSTAWRLWALLSGLYLWL